MNGDPPDLVMPEPPDDPPFCDVCMSYGHDNHDCFDPYCCPGSFTKGEYKAVGTLMCKHCGMEFIDRRIPMHEEKV